MSWASPARPGRLPSVRIGAVTVSPGLANAVVMRSLRRSMPRLLHCYEQGLLRDSRAGGRLTVRYTIEPNGVVSRVVAEADETLAQVAQCLQRVVPLSGPYPQPAGLVAVSVVVPLQFVAPSS